METQIQPPTEDSEGLWRAHQRNNGSAPLMSGTKLPPDPPWSQAMQSAVLWQCCPQAGLRAKESISEWVGSFKQNAWNSSSFHLTQQQCPLVSTASPYGDFTSWHWSLGWGLVSGRDSLLLRGTSETKIALLIFNTCNECGPNPPGLCPSHQSLHGFFMHVITGLLFRGTSASSPCWLLCSLFVIVMWSWKKANIAFTLLPSWREAWFYFFRTGLKAISIFFIFEMHCQVIFIIILSIYSHNT